jgi:hypothetical protein
MRSATFGVRKAGRARASAGQVTPARARRLPLAWMQPRRQP